MRGQASVTAGEALEALIALFAQKGFQRVEPAVLQPADVFVDLSGEDIRRRMFVTQDAAGAEFCLRPEYTIPVCLSHLSRGGWSPPRTPMPGRSSGCARASPASSCRRASSRSAGPMPLRRMRTSLALRSRGSTGSASTALGCGSATWGCSTRSSKPSACRPRQSGG